MSVPDWDRIRKDLETWKSMPLVPNLPFYRGFVVIDEKQSVAWNHEEVRKINDTYYQAEKDLHTAKNKFKEQLDDLIATKIVDELEGRITKKSALKLYSYAYDKGRFSSNNTDTVVECLIDLLEIIKRVMKGEYNVTHQAQHQ